MMAMKNYDEKMLEVNKTYQNNAEYIYFEKVKNEKIFDN